MRTKLGDFGVEEVCCWRACLLNIEPNLKNIVLQNKKGRVLEDELTFKAVKKIRMHVSLENQCHPSLLASGEKDEKSKFMLYNLIFYISKTG